MGKWARCILMLSAFSAAQEPSCPMESGRDGFGAWMQKTGLSEGKSYQATQARTRNIKEGSKKLKLGMDRKEVEALLGKPDFVAPGRSPRVIAPSNPDFKARCWYQWTYYFEKKSPDLFDAQDKFVF